MNSGDFRLLIGLGNPGATYKSTRHNIGFMALQQLAEKKGVSFRQQKKLHGLLAEVREDSNLIRLLMPDTFMNNSGRSIRAALDWFDIEINQIIVLVDDLDLPLGKLRLRAQGSSGGHNGLKSAIEHLGTDKFCRLRIGIGNPECLPTERKSKTISHVLGNFTQKESSIVSEVLDEVLLGLDLLTKQGIDHAGNRLNAYTPKALE